MKRKLINAIKDYMKNGRDSNDCFITWMDVNSLIAKALIELGREETGNPRWWFDQYHKLSEFIDKFD